MRAKNYGFIMKIMKDLVKDTVNNCTIVSTKTELTE